MEPNALSLEKRIEQLLEKALREIRESIVKELFKELVEILKEMANRINQLTSRVDELTQRVNQLTMRVNELTQRVNQLTIRVDELTENVNRITIQIGKLTGVVGEIRGKVTEWMIIDSLKGVLKRYNFEVYASPWKLFDAYIITDDFLAIVEICTKCRIDDVDQVKRAVGTAIDKLGAKPDTLIVFSLEKPADEVIEYGRKLNVIVENSPIRLAKKLCEILKERKMQIRT